MSFAEIIYPSLEATILHATTAMPSNEKAAASPIARISKKIDFLLCNSCFWCASYLNMRVVLALLNVLPVKKVQ